MGPLTQLFKQPARHFGLAVSADEGQSDASSRRRFLTLCATIFLIALGVRLLGWHDNRFEATKVEWMVVADYKTAAHQLLAGDFQAFFGDPYLAGHPPGYSIFLAAIFKVFGDSNTAIQLIQITVDALSTVVVFLIVSELFTKRVAITAGLLVALSPQFAYYALLLLPDSITVLPILVAVYLLIRASKRPHLLTVAAAGAFIGLSCWLRANALLMPLFFSAATLILFERGKRLRYSLALVAGAIVTIAPVTIKNYIAFHHFIPVSLGAGQKLLEGIAEYDDEGRYGIPKSDLGIMRQEAELYQRPDYANVLFGPDGVKRDRLRLARGLAVIRSHPGWYLGVMARRAASFFRLARVPIVSPDPPVTHSLETTDRAPMTWSNSPAELVAKGVAASDQTKISLAEDGRFMEVSGDDSKYGKQFVSEPAAVQKYTNYLFRVPVKLEQGRMVVGVEDVAGGVSLSSTIIDLDEGKSPEDQPTNVVSIPFVSESRSQVRITLSNGGASDRARLRALVGGAEMFELGPTSYRWTRFPRFFIRNIQRFFITAWVLPFVVIGIALLVRMRRVDALAVLLVVPLYYICVQSALHTERRYVIAIHYFLAATAAVPLYALMATLWESMRGLARYLRKRVA